MLYVLHKTSMIRHMNLNQNSAAVTSVNTLVVKNSGNLFLQKAPEEKTNFAFRAEGLADHKVFIAGGQKTADRQHQPDIHLDAGEDVRAPRLSAKADGRVGVPTLPG